MTDDLERLRQAMTDLSEHGGHADLYGRTLRKSRQSQRRSRLLAGTASAAAVFTIGGAVAYATADRPNPPPPIATPSPFPTPTPTSAVPSAAPTSKPPPSKAQPPSKARPSTPPPESTTTSSPPPRYPDCPSAKTLEKLADLPKDWTFVPSSVQCWHNWASAAPQGSTVGDGVYLFHYKTGTGWRYHSQGSSFRCQDLGITAGDPPFCEME